MALEAPFTMCDEKVAGTLRACLFFFFPRWMTGTSAPVIITQMAAQLPPVVLPSQQPSRSRGLRGGLRVGVERKEGA